MIDLFISVCMQVSFWASGVRRLDAYSVRWSPRRTATRRSALAAMSGIRAAIRDPTSPTGSASAAVEASVGISTLAGQARRDTPLHLDVTATFGHAARDPRRSQSIFTEPHLGTAVQRRRRRHDRSRCNRRRRRRRQDCRRRRRRQDRRHDRRRRFRVEVRVVATGQGFPRHTAA